MRKGSGPHLSGKTCACSTWRLSTTLAPHRKAECTSAEKKLQHRRVWNKFVNATVNFTPHIVKNSDAHFFLVNSMNSGRKWTEPLCNCAMHKPWRNWILVRLVCLKQTWECPVQPYYIRMTCGPRVRDENWLRNQPQKEKGVAKKQCRKKTRISNWDIVRKCSKYRAVMGVWRWQKRKHTGEIAAVARDLTYQLSASFVEHMSEYRYTFAARSANIPLGSAVNVAWT